MYALTGATGKIGGAVLDALLQFNLVPRNELVIVTTSSLQSQRTARLRSLDVAIRQAKYTDPQAFQLAVQGCHTLFLVSTPAIELDYDDAPYGHGREAEHFSAIDAAIKGGIKRIVYTSLAFKDPSKAGVMRAHFRTEDYLAQQLDKGLLQSYTSVREGLYAESWPLYAGFYALTPASNNDVRKEIVLAGDGIIRWTSIADLGIGTAYVLTTDDYDEKFANKTIFLSSQKSALTIAQVAQRLDAKILPVTIDEYIQHYAGTGPDKDPKHVYWWSSTYPSLIQGHADVQDTLLDDILAKFNRTPDPFDKVFATMMEATKRSA